MALGMRAAVRLLAGLVVLLLAALPSSARADEGDNEIGACLGSGQVWLLVITDGDQVLANQCVGTPSTGIDALARGGMRLGFGKGTLICSIGGYPDPCPTTWTGAYWAYFQGSPGKDYTYSSLGAESATPVGGAIEAWCYTVPPAKSCTPPQLEIVQGGAAVAPPSGSARALPVTQNPAVSPPSSTPWPTLIVAAVVVAAAVGLVLWKRSSRKDGPRGGR
ncbi:MAG: hypothetical protein QM713_04630 [Arachnia sp.]